MTKHLFYNITIKDVLISLLILGVTFGYYLIDYIPEGRQTIDLYFFEIGTFGFNDILQLANYAKMKFLIIILCVIWYFTCQHWWKFGILIIIVIELSKLISTLISKYHSTDEIDYLVSLPFTIPIIMLLIFLSFKLNSYNLNMEIRSKIDEEIGNVLIEINSKSKIEIYELKNRFLKLKQMKSKMDSIMYLKKLIEIRNSLCKPQNEDSI